MEANQIKEIIRRELPALMRHDPDFRRFVIDIARTQFADKSETESRFDRVLEELRRDREEQARKWDEQVAKWHEQDKKWDAQVAKWHEQDKKWYENHNLLKAMQTRIESGIGALGARWGIFAEESFRNGLAGILENSFGVEVLNVTEYDDKGEVFGVPDQVELDIIVKNSTLILCEIKSSMSRGDVYLFDRKIAFYEKRHDRKADRKIIISPMVDKRGLQVAEKLNMEVYSHSTDIGKL
jgi:hypothetical protein